MCGKDRQRKNRLKRNRGSPPHVRERLVPISFRQAVVGITPACAGKTAGPTRCSSRAQDHPRMCGKDLIRLPKIRKSLGSPPHVRERHPSGRCRVPWHRITPACAGKTNIFLPANSSLQDHPRMCGKDSYQSRFALWVQGSPPHVRERQQGCRFFSRIRRITPACAGKTSLYFGSMRWSRDHPRMCGKDSKLNRNNADFTGSPPHVRERHRIGHLGAAELGITPACAGKT